MILGFSTQLHRKPTYFVEKITIGLVKSNVIAIDLASELLNMPISEIRKSELKPKLHTIRDDNKDRWQAGMKIDFFVYCRQKNMFRFDPEIPVVSTQDVFMTYAHSDLIQISIDGRELFSYTERLEFAINDGFDTWEDFFNYFYPKIKASPKECYKAKLIHWTDLKY